MQCNKQRQQGLAVIEFAIILPFIIVLALVVTELGRGLYQYNTLNKAVRDGARYLADNANLFGTVDIYSDLNLIPDTRNLVVYGDVDGVSSGLSPLLPSFSTATVEPTELAVPSSGPVNHIEVTAKYTFQPLFSGSSALGFSMIPEIVMTATTTQRALRL